MGRAMQSRPALLDVVELREPRSGHPAGTVGAVVELFATEALHELADEHGQTLELLSVPYDALRAHVPEPARRRATG